MVTSSIHREKSAVESALTRGRQRGLNFAAASFLNDRHRRAAYRAVVVSSYEGEGRQARAMPRGNFWRIGASNDAVVCHVIEL